MALSLTETDMDELEAAISSARRTVRISVVVAGLACLGLLVLVFADPPKPGSVEFEFGGFIFLAAVEFTAVATVILIAVWCWAAGLLNLVSQGLRRIVARGVSPGSWAQADASALKFLPFATLGVSVIWLTHQVIHTHLTLLTLRVAVVVLAAVQIAAFAVAWSRIVRRSRVTGESDGSST